MDVIEGIPQTVVDHGVDRLPVAHALAVTRVGQHVRRQGHVFLTAGQNQLGIAATDGLGGQVQRLEARPADLVDGHGGHAFRQACLDDRLTCRVLTAPCCQHLTQKHFIDLIATDTRAGEDILDDMCAEIRGGNASQAATEGAYGGTTGCYDHHILHLNAPVLLRDCLSQLAATMAMPSSGRGAVLLR